MGWKHKSIFNISISLKAYATIYVILWGSESESESET